MPFSTAIKKKKSWVSLRLNNTQASLCWLHAGNICYSNFTTISDYVYWDPVFNADSIGFEVFLRWAFCPTANEQLRDCLQVFGFLWISLWRCPSELGASDRCRHCCYLLIQNELPLCQILWFDLCFRHWHNPQDCGRLTGKYHRRRVNMTEIKLVTFQTWKTRYLGHKPKGLKQPHYILCLKKHACVVWDLPFCQDYFIYGTPNCGLEVLGSLLSIYPSNKWKSRFSWLLTLIIQRSLYN